MSAFLWAGCGASFLSGVMYFALGLSRPVEWKHIAFAVSMMILAVYFGLQETFYYSTDLQYKVEIVRYQIYVIIAFFAAFGPFLALYTHWDPPGWVVKSFGVYLGIAALYNYLSPYTLYFVGPPKIATHQQFGGDSIHLLEAPVNFFVISLFTFQLIVVVGGAYLVFTRKREKKLILAALLIGLASLSSDFVHDLVSGTWPYTGEFSAALFAFLMSLELALDFRTKENHLARALDSTIKIRDQLNTPLQTLALGLDLIAVELPEKQSLIERLRNSVTRLEGLGRGLHKDELFKSSRQKREEKAPL